MHVSLRLRGQGIYRWPYFVIQNINLILTLYIGSYLSMLSFNAMSMID